eukprot:46390-Chlamydomonas_euryale.AAC.4
MAAYFLVPWLRSPTSKSWLTCTAVVARIESGDGKGRLHCQDGIRGWEGKAYLMIGSAACNSQSRVDVLMLLWIDQEEFGAGCHGPATAMFLQGLLLTTEPSQSRAVPLPHAVPLPGRR